MVESHVDPSQKAVPDHNHGEHPLWKVGAGGIQLSQLYLVSLVGIADHEFELMVSYLP